MFVRVCLLNFKGDAVEFCFVKQVVCRGLGCGVGRKGGVVNV